jgi:diguanylate cyclase (GGDEF)-like protein/PAS domain S-box-containing protein
MTIDIFISTLMNVLLLMSLALVYSVYSMRTNVSHIIRKVTMGLAVTAIGIIVMLYPYESIPGVFFDGRSMVILTSAMYLGFIPTLIGGLSMILYRISEGGVGLAPGILEIIIPAILGLIWRYKRLKAPKVKIEDITILEQYGVVFTGQLIALSIGFLFPKLIPTEVIFSVAFPMLAIYPFGGLAVSMFMLLQRRIYFSGELTAENKKKYEAYFNNSSIAMFIYSTKTKKFISANTVAENLYGYTKEELCKMGIANLNPLLESEIDKLVKLAMENKKSFFKAKHMKKNGEIIDVETRTNTIDIDNETCLFLSIIDVTDRVISETKYQNVNIRLKSTLANITEGIVITDNYGTIELMNKSAQEIIGLKKPVLNVAIGSTIRIHIDKKNVTFDSIFNEVLTTNKPVTMSSNAIIIKNDNNDKRQIGFTLSPITFEDNITRGTILIFRDITLDQERVDKIQFISQHDHLTGLYNRYFLEEEMKRLDTPRQLPFSVILGDVNGLKLVNDAFGHQEGDTLLNEISSILKKSTRSEDILGRWGGDEFLILLPQTTYNNALKVVERINDLSKKSHYEVITPSISIGLATKTNQKETLKDTIQDAEKAMYAIKTEIGPVMRKALYQKLISKFEEIDPYYKEHSKRSADLITEFAKYIGKTDKEVKLLRKIAINHDIGKISLDESLITKKRTLTDIEQKRLQIHPEIGYRILNALPELADISKYVLHHHEHYDGTGYPEGLKGEDIPFYSRMLSIVEAFDSMTNSNTYDHKMTKREALIELKVTAGTIFDPELVKSFTKMIEDKQKQD